MNYDNFANKLIEWQKQFGRNDLPWQKNPTPYRVWVSEIMLQQTQVKTVIPYYLRFLNRFPNLKELANASLDEVLLHWAGLGYYARARNLHQCAKTIAVDHQGKFPNLFDQLIKLPGIGRSTAGAILSFAFNQPTSILDGNVKRILCRVYRIEDPKNNTNTLKKLWELSNQHTPTKNTFIYNQAMMDLGANICIRNSPLCFKCPVIDLCQSAQNNQQHLFPRSQSRKALPLKRTYMFLLTNSAGEILFEKRPPTGIWGGLWALPFGDLNLDISDQIMQNFNLKIISLDYLPIFYHQFSHFRMEIHPVSIAIQNLPRRKLMENGNKEWYKNDQIKTIGLPKPVSKLLNQIFNNKIFNDTHKGILT